MPVSIGRYFPIAVILTCLCSIGAHSKPTPDVKLWHGALDKYMRGNYRAAILPLREIIESGHSNLESSARLLLGKSYLRQGMLGEAREAARELIAKFSYSRYAPYAHQLNAQVAFLQKNWEECAWQLLITAQTAQDDDLNLWAREKLEEVFAAYLDEEQQRDILKWVRSAEILAELQAARRGFRLPMKVGVVLPLSGSQEAAGQGILAGIQSAYEMLMQNGTPNFELLIRDSRGQVLTAVRAAQELVNEERVVALIGDLGGSCSAAIAAVAAARHIPLVIPAAPDVGLTQIGNNVFQLVANYSLEGKLSAAYAMTIPGVKYAAILAPVSEAGLQQARSFQKQFEVLGGKVSSVQWYYPEATSFKRQLDALTKIGAQNFAERYKLTEEQIEKLIAWADRQDKDAEESESEQDAEQSEILDLIGAPINFFNVIYVPTQGEEISFLAPQISAAGFTGILIGSAACLTSVAQESNQPYVNGMIFPSHFPSANKFSADPDFVREFPRKDDIPPNRWNVLGWDALNYLQAALRGWRKVKPGQLTNRLHTFHEFQGVRLKMIFPHNTSTNHALYLLSFYGGNFHQIMSPEKVVEQFLP